MKYYIVKTHSPTHTSTVINSADNYVDAEQMLAEHLDVDRNEEWVYGILPAITHSTQHVEQDKTNAM